MSGAPVFVLSTGRCGTLSLQRFFQRSSHLEAFQRYRGRWAEYRNDMSFILEQNYTYYKVIKNPDPPSDLKQRAIERLRRARMPLIDRLSEEGKGFVETNHGFSSYGPLLGEAYPDASFIHLYRHPKKVVSSFMRKFDPPPMARPAFFGTRYSLKGQMVLRFGHLERLADSEWCPSFLSEYVHDLEHDRHLHPFKKANGRWREDDSMSPFEKTVWYWARINELILEFLENLPEQRTLTVRSERLFNRDEDVYRRLIDFVGPPDLTTGDLRSFYGTKTNPKSVKNDFPTAEEWTMDMTSVLVEETGDLLERMNLSPEMQPDESFA